MIQSPQFLIDKPLLAMEQNMTLLKMFKLLLVQIITIYKVKWNNNKKLNMDGVLVNLDKKCQEMEYLVNI